MITCFCCKSKTHNVGNVRGLEFCADCAQVVLKLITPRDGIREIGNLVRGFRALARAADAGFLARIK